MKYTAAIAYIPDTSVLFELEDGNFALVSVGDEDARYLITVSKFAESFLKFGGFKDGADIPEEMLNEAAETLKKGEKVFMSKDLRLK